MSKSIGGYFNAKKLILFSLPSIVMMVFMSFYTIVDGMFVSANVSTIALGAINIVYPVVAILQGFGIMLATGGSAIIAKKLGENKEDEARSNFTFIILCELFVGVLFLIIGHFFSRELTELLGGRNEMLEEGTEYLRVILYFSPFFMLQVAFQTFFVTASKPAIGLFSTVAGGLLNILFDWLFIVVLDQGIIGASLGSGISFIIPGVVGLIYFTFFRKNSLHFSKCKFHGKMLVDSMKNGSSEMVTNIASAVTTILFNYQCLKYFGDDGVAAITIVLYFQFVLLAIFYGYATGVSPIVSYKFGAEEPDQIKKIYNTSLIITAVTSVISFGLALGLIRPVAILFAKGNQNVIDITVNYFYYYAPAFLMMGYAIFASAFFTALNDGKTSAIISFSHTLLFLVITLLLMPLLFEKIGIFIAVPVAELLGLIVTIYYLIKKKKKYMY